MPRDSAETSPSSSSFIRSDLNEPSRSESKDGLTEEELQRRLAALPPGLRPSSRRLRTTGAVVEALAGDPFRIPLPDALDLVGEYGVPACEGAILKTLAHLPGGGIRNPLRWVIATIRKGKGWSQEQVGVYMGGLLEATLERLRSGNPTEQRLARDLEKAWGEAPENVTDFRAARAQ